VFPNPDFNDTPLFKAEYLRNGTRQKHSYNGILERTYAIFYDVNLNDLE